MSLLTDSDIEKMLGIEYGRGVKPLHGRIAKAQQTKTLKAVAEWLRTHCTDHYKAEHAIQRWGCYQCIDALIAKANEGKIPGEE